jgi:RNA polymerase sigma-70 factor (ECF subfamily)
MDDRQIVELFFARSEEAIRETDAKYGRLCYRIAQNILGRDADAEECVNDAYLCLWNAIPPQKPDDLAAYICKIVRNVSLKRLRFNSAMKRNIRAEVSLNELESILPDSMTGSEMDDRQLGKVISAFLWRESESSRNVFIRKYFFFDSVHEIAERYSYSESKVKSMLFHTRRRLQNYLLKEGYEL